MHVLRAPVLKVDAGQTFGVDREDATERLGQPFRIPLFGVDSLAAVGFDLLVDNVLGQGHQIFPAVDELGLPAVVRRVAVSHANLAFKQFPSQRVDVLPLLVHHVRRTR